MSLQPVGLIDTSLTIDAREPESDAVNATVRKTAVIGASGYVGGHLWNAYRARHPDCVGTGFSRAREELTHFDIRNPQLDALRLEDSGHEAVLISSAKPNIGYCDQQPEESYAVNVRGMLDLMRHIARTSMQIIFLSSDYAFEGHGDHDDNSPTRPTTEYGRQKVAVEQALPELTDNYLILRLSKIYGVRKGDNTLLDEVAAGLAAGREMKVARDQIFCPTHVDDLTAAIHGIQKKGLRGTLNVCSPERWSRCDVATRLAAAMQCDPQLLKTISLHDLPGMASRPLNTSMLCTRLTNEVGSVFRGLEESIAEVAANWRSA